MSIKDNLNDAAWDLGYGRRSADRGLRERPEAEELHSAAGSLGSLK